MCECNNRPRQTYIWRVSDVHFATPDCTYIFPINGL